MIPVGWTTRVAVEKEDWFRLGYRATSYSGLDQPLAQLKAAAGSFQVMLFFGDWCPDTHLQLPGFIKLMDQAKISPETFQWIHLDRKKSFLPLTQSHRIERVPTFVFLRASREIGRIVERPQESLLEDILNFIRS